MFGIQGQLQTSIWEMNMKFITWNCQGAFRKKADIILAQRPDILVVQECEHPDKLVFNSTTLQPNDYLWFGDNIHKGIGIFSYGKFKFQLLNQYNPDLKYIIPISVSDGKKDFTLFAIWANNPNDPGGRYIEQVWKALKCYDQLLEYGKTILAGDFNSNTIWDRPRRIGSHSTVVACLKEKNIYSVYHTFLDQEQGKEAHPTFFLHRNLDKPYHLDYCFVSESLYNQINNIEVGTFENWKTHSDHVPIIIDFSL